jgi:hypothetical protein
MRASVMARPTATAAAVRHMTRASRMNNRAIRETLLRASLICLAVRIASSFAYVNGPTN